MAWEELLRLPGDRDRVAEARREYNAVWLAGALTVGEMLKLLGQMDPAMPLMLPGGEGGLTPAMRVERVAVQLGVNRLDGFGPHEVAVEDGDADTMAVVLLPRGSAGV